MSNEQDQAPKAPLSPNTVVQDTYDRFMFKNVHSASGDVKSLVGARPEDTNLASDVFSSFYKMSPQIEPNSPEPQRTMMEALHKLPEFEATRGYTRFDEVGATLATLKFAPAMLSQFRKVREKLEKEAAGKPGKPGQGQPGADGEPGEPGPGGLDESTMQEFRNAARKALGEAADEADKWHAAVNSFGFDPDELAQLPTAKKLELAKTLLRNPSIARIAALVGKFKNMAFGAKATTPTHGFDEIVDIGQGSEIARLLPAEMIKYSRMRTLFYKDMAEGSLAIYNMKGTDYLGLGPLVICDDVSGSMAGDREEWGKAVILAFVQIAEKQKRPVAVFLFESRVVASWLFPKGKKISIQDKMDFLAFGSNGGGTDYVAALDKALDFIAKAGGAEFRPADIVFVTDGDYSFQPAMLREVLTKKEKSAVRIFGMNVAGQNAQIDQSLSKFCDAVFTIDDKGDVSQARGAFLGVMKRQERKPAKKGA